MSQSDRCFLSSRLVADGISQQAFLFEFLPLYMSNVQSNSALTLSNGLHVLVESIDRIEEYIKQSSYVLNGTTLLNVREMADLAGRVRTLRMFEQSVGFLKIVRKFLGGNITFVISYSKEYLDSTLSQPVQSTLLRDHLERSRTIRSVEAIYNSM